MPDGLLVRRSFLIRLETVGEVAVEPAFADARQNRRILAPVFGRHEEPCETLSAARLPHAIERFTNLLDAPQVLDHAYELVHVQQRLVVDLQVVGALEILFDPELQQVVQQIFQRSDAPGRSVVLVHDREPEAIAIARLEQPLVHRVAEEDAVGAHGPAFRAAIPAVDEVGDAVLETPLDLPVGDLGIAFVVVAEQGCAIGVGNDGVPSEVAAAVLPPSREIMRSDQVVGRRRLRLRHGGARRSRSTKGRRAHAGRHRQRSALKPIPPADLSHGFMRLPDRTSRSRSVKSCKAGKSLYRFDSVPRLR